MHCNILGTIGVLSHITERVILRLYELAKLAWKTPLDLPRYGMGMIMHEREYLCTIGKI